MARDRFPDGVTGQLKWYVYRLIDSRNGETFYVGKGQGDRVFSHANGEYADTGRINSEENEDDADLRLRRIRDIRAAGLDVGHVVHRHGIEHEDVAYQIEAALIDAYPGLTNQVEGHGSGDYGSRHVEEIIRQYSADPFEVKHPLILIYIGATYPNRRDNTYEAVRCAWKVSRNRV